jgi:hypothetical protein
MAGRIPYIDKKALIRSVLLKRAMESMKTLTYGQLGKIVSIPTRGPWKPILDLIADEDAPEPDLTYLVVNKKTGYPSQIGRLPAKPPSASQKKRAVEEAQRLIVKYNRNARNPFI